MPLEAQGYSDVEAGRVTTFLPDWSPARAAESGASACKLLLPYRPDHEASAVLQDAVVAEAVAGCRAVGLPLILEPIAYPLPSEDASDARRAGSVRSCSRRSSACGRWARDILKLQFPRDAEPPPRRSGASRIDVACGETPWVLLGGGGDAEGFARDVEASCRPGASGFIAGPHAVAGRARAGGRRARRTARGECVPLVQRLRALAERTRQAVAHGGSRTSPSQPPADWWSAD